MKYTAIVIFVLLAISLPILLPTNIATANGANKYDTFEDVEYSYSLKREKAFDEIKIVDRKTLVKDRSIKDARIAYIIGDEDDVTSVLFVFVAQPDPSNTKSDVVNHLMKSVKQQFTNITQQPEVTETKKKIDGKRQTCFNLIGTWKDNQKNMYAKCVIIENANNWVVMMMIENVDFHNDTNKDSKKMHKAMHNIVLSYKSTKQDETGYEVFEDVEYPYLLKKSKFVKGITTVGTKKIRKDDDNARVAYFIGKDDNISSMLTVYVTPLWPRRSHIDQIREAQTLVEGFFTDYQQKPKIKTSKDKIGGRKYYYFDLTGRWKLHNREVYAKCMFIENDDIWVIMVLVDDLEFMKNRDKEAKKLRNELNNIIYSYKSTRPKK